MIGKRPAQKVVKLIKCGDQNADHANKMWGQNERDGNLPSCIWGCSILTHTDFGSLEFEVMVVNDVYIVWVAKEPGMEKMCSSTSGTTGNGSIKPKVSWSLLEFRPS